MRDPFGVFTSGSLRVACQILNVEHLARGTLVDLVTLEPCDRGPERVPAGTPLALGFGSQPEEKTRVELESIMNHWEQGNALLKLEVADVAGGLRYEFSCGNEQLVLLVEAGPSAS